jgi:hypothetical protein
MTPGICSNLVSVAESHQRSVPSFHLRERSTEDLRHYLRGILAIKGRARIALWDQFRVIGAVARARHDQPTGSHDSPRLGQSEPGIIQMVEHPQKHHGVETALCDGQKGGIGSDNRTVWAGSELARGFVDPKPSHSATERRGESTDTASHVQDPFDLLAHESLDHWAVHVLLPTHLE